MQRYFSAIICLLLLLTTLLPIESRVPNCTFYSTQPQLPNAWRVTPSCYTLFLPAIAPILSALVLSIVSS
jgi:hypothetical protein